MMRMWAWPLLGLLTLLPDIACAQAVKLRLTLQVAITEPYLGLPIAHFRDEVANRSEKAIAIEVFDKGQLYIDNQVVGAVASGAVEMGVAGTYQFAKKVPEITLVEQPFLLNFAALLRAATSPDSELRMPIDQAVAERVGVRVLWWQPVGTTVFFSKGAAVTEPDAIAGRRVRVFSEITAQFARACGGQPTVISTAKMHDAAKNGLVDLSMGSITSVEPRALWQVADTVTVTNHVPIEFLLIVNERAWQALSPAHQAIIAEAARVAERAARDRMAENETAAYAFARAKGMRILNLTADQVADWRACSAVVLEDYLGQDGKLARRLLGTYGRLRTHPCCAAEPSLAGAPFHRR
jgi:TRAP-type C4-dicarboxylate transport system substrate-binding protein